MNLRCAASLLALALTSCSRPGAEAAPLRIAATASMRVVVEEIGRAFAQSPSGAEVTVNAAASGVLRRQIEHGDAADVFISANREHMDALLTRGRVAPETVHVLARNRLVVAAPAGRHVPMESLRGLSHPPFARIALATPATAPVGELAVAALQSAGVWSSVESRVLYAENAAQIAAYLRTGEVDAALLYVTDVIGLGDAVDRLCEVDPALHPPSEYLIGVVADSRLRVRAEAFVEFARGPEAAAILAQAGFLVDETGSR